MDFLSSILAGIVANIVSSLFKPYDLIIDKLNDLFTQKEIKDKEAGEDSTTIHKIQNKLSNAKNEPLVIIGSIYVDLGIDPIGTKKLGKEEWTGIHPIRFTLAGSAIYVGQYLYKQYKQKSYLISAIGKLNNNVVIINEGKKLLKEEEWIIDTDSIIPIPAKDTATTASLVQQENKYATMFTHTGALTSLTWELIEKPLKKTIGKNGIIYLSGFLKTGLYQNLDDKLRTLSKDHVICIDHGRLMPKIGDNNNSLVALKNAFVQKSVDIYICTFNEILNYHNHTNKRNFRKPIIKNRYRTLKNIARKRKLAPITIVRGIGVPKYIEAYVIICKEVYPINISQKEAIKTTATLPKSIFNAVFLQTLINNQEEGDIKTRVERAAQEALQRCHEAIEIPIRGEPKDKVRTEDDLEGSNDNKKQLLQQLLSEVFPEEDDDEKVEKAINILLDIEHSK